LVRFDFHLLIHLLNCTFRLVPMSTNLLWLATRHPGSPFRGYRQPA
jgi:hypothetical protein